MATTLILIALVIFIAGAAAGIIVVVSAGIRREERDLASRRDEPDFTLTLQAPDRVSQGARVLTGLHVLGVGTGVDNRETTLV